MDTIKQSLDHFAKGKEYIEDYAEHPEKFHTQYPSKYMNATEEQGQLINELSAELSHALSKSLSYDKEYPLMSLAYQEKLKRLTS